MNVANHTDGFRLLRHQAPRYDTHGKLKETRRNPELCPDNILSKNIVVPQWWSGNEKGERRTKQTIINERKRSLMPDPTYDLDGDGIVCDKDYFISKRFDIDCDGKLNAKEKQNAMEAISRGYEDQFRWGVEKLGVFRGNRLIQIRGKIIEAEDFQGIKDTYPQHPLSAIQTEVQTQSELKKRRREENIKSLAQKKEQWDRENPTSVPQKFNNSEFLVEVPAHRSINEIKANYKQRARKAAGLNPQPNDVKRNREALTTTYVSNPEISTQTALQQFNRQQLLENVTNESTKKSAVERLNIREESLLRESQRHPIGLTYRHISSQRRKEMIEYNIKTFGKTSIGIHGRELPKFSQDARLAQYWKFRNSYVAEPRHISRDQVHQSYTNHTGNDSFTATNFSEKMADPDPFKTMYVPKVKNMEIAPKVTEINKFNVEEEEPCFVNHTKKRWTELANKFKKKDPSVLCKSTEIKQEKAPLYSSFTADKTFVEPLKSMRTQTAEKRSRTHNATKTNRTISLAYRAPKENLVSRVVRKRTLGGNAEMDIRRIKALGVRTSAF